MKSQHNVHFLSMIKPTCDKEFLSQVVHALWCDVWWTKAREAQYRNAVGSQFIPDITERVETPAAPNREQVLLTISFYIGRIEQAWGATFGQIAQEMSATSDQALLSFVVDTLRRCLGYKVDGWHCFPAHLDPKPIYIPRTLFHVEDK